MGFSILPVIVPVSVPVSVPVRVSLLFTQEETPFPPLIDPRFARVLRRSDRLDDILRCRMVLTRGRLALDLETLTIYIYIYYF